jgi:thymidylate synthase
MSITHFMGETLDDLMRDVLIEIQKSGDQIEPTKGLAREIRGVVLELANPRARLSRTETRGKPYSCLGELCWYLAKTNRLPFISYYIPAYRQYADGDEIFGGYGTRLFEWRGLNQIENVIELLRKKPQSRQAVLQLFDCHDLVGDHKDVPCTCTLQLMLRGGQLHLFANMRSNDVFWGLPHDVFCFTMLQELIARTLRVELGTYKHAVGSLHLYDKSRDSARRFLKEGWQSTKTDMPEMPIGNPWPAVSLLLQAEADIRTQGVLSVNCGMLDAYWMDLIRLLQVYRCKKDKTLENLKSLRDNMACNVYLPFINKLLNKTE